MIEKLAEKALAKRCGFWVVVAVLLLLAVVFGYWFFYPAPGAPA